MHFSLLVACLTCVQYVAAVPQYIFRKTFNDFTPRSQTSGEIQQTLGPQLSTNASIYFPGSLGYTEGASRWSTHANPNILVVVEVTTAEDVAATIKCANSVNMPFLAVNRGHGNVDTLARMQNGIEIWLTQLNSIEVSEDGNTAVLGGGVYIKEVIDELAKHKKVAASGACGCVGLMGAGLGGGHGRLQGYFGLVSDNFVDLNVVLWNGTQVNVSATSYPDLFWALQGAGHNFGVVTSLTYKIHDEPSPIWFYGTYSFTQDKLEPVFEELIRQTNATLPREMGYVYVNYMWDTNISTTEPILVLILNFAGEKEAAAPHAEPFKVLHPVSSVEGEVPYVQIAKATGTDVDDAACDRGKEYFLHAADLVTYNVSTNRAIFELFKNMTMTYPEYQESAVMFESYSQQGLKAVDPNSTAFPNRGSNIIFALTAIYPTNPDLDQRAVEWGEQTRSLVHTGQGPEVNLEVYVNYAYGNETMESLYGYEPWRLEKLRA